MEAINIPLRCFTILLRKQYLYPYLLIILFFVKKLVLNIICCGHNFVRYRLQAWTDGGQTVESDDDGIEAGFGRERIFCKKIFEEQILRSTASCCSSAKDKNWSMAKS